jgi:nucleoside-diphosphate-sugar epimerase
VDHCCVPEEQGCQPENEHHNEYTRSKAVAETLLRESGLPVLTVRPTIVLSAGLPDPEFARSILWFAPLLKAFECLPVDPASRIDVVPVSYVAEATVELLMQPRLHYDCYHISAGPEACSTIGSLNDLVNQYYKRKQPLRLIPPVEWTKTHYRTHIRSDRQREIFLGLRHYLPFLNMDVVFDNSRLKYDLGEQSHRIVPVEEYLGNLLDLIRWKKALQELARP